MSNNDVKRYTAAGGVVVHNGRVLVLFRPSRAEVRLPKGHVDPGESPRETALRETREESGYHNVAVQADLGTQRVEFDYKGHHFIRREFYFLMGLVEPEENSPAAAEAQFQPAWLSWKEALAQLSFEAEREWIRRAQRALQEG